MSLLEDIRKQPRTVREIMFGLSVVTTLSLVGAIWFQSFERNIYALMNPDSRIEKRYAVEVEIEKESPLAFLGSAIEGLRAMVGSLFWNDEPSISPNQSDNRQTDPHTLPLSK